MAHPPPLEILIRTIGRRRRYERGQALFRAGERAAGIHVVLEGRVRVTRSAPSGRAVVVHHETAGGVLGEIPLFDGERYPSTAVAAEATVCVLLPGEALRREITRNPELARFFLTRLAQRLRDVINRLDAMATRSVAQRLARHLLDRSRTSGSASVSLGMSQEELAEDLGTVREVIVRELRLFCRAGVLGALGRGRYEIRDPRALRTLAD